MALRTLSLVVDEGTVLALLGANGAGKSTTIAMMTGAVRPSWGDAFVYGQSVRHRVSAVQRLIGVCPQDDVLWGELTAAEHCELFAVLKGVPRRQAAAAARARLEQLSLGDVVDARIDSFSGGMRRRVSVALAAMGEPRVIFLDEPSTGLDPLSRRRVWDAVERLKVGRVIVLTTHSMHEADVLADRIAILADGVVRVTGTPLELKRRHGAGFRVRVTAVTEARVRELVERVRARLPSSRLVAASGCSLLFELPAARGDELVAFAAWLDDGHESVVDWSLADTSLEDVFLMVAGKKED